MNPPIDAVFFGCLYSSGHFSYASSPTHYLGARPLAPSGLPRELVSSYSMDGPYCPDVTWHRSGCHAPWLVMPLEQPEGFAALHHLDGWTVLAFWDRSADHRHGSSSTYALRGTLAFAQAQEAARAAFPQIWARYTFPIVRGRAGEPR